MHNPASPLGFRKSFNLLCLFEAFKCCLNLLQPLLVSASWDIARTTTIPPQGDQDFLFLLPSTAQQQAEMVIAPSMQMRELI